MQSIMSSKARISMAVNQLREVIDKEIEGLIGSVKSMPNLAGEDAAIAIRLASECSSIREQLRLFLGSKTPAKLPEELPTPKPIACVEPAPKRLKLALSRAEAAETLGISSITLDRLVSRGLLKPSLATRRPLFAPAELERFMRDTSAPID